MLYVRQVFLKKILVYSRKSFFFAPNSAPFYSASGFVFLKNVNIFATDSYLYLSAQIPVILSALMCSAAYQETTYVPL